MKNLLYTTLFIMSLSACTSQQKVEENKPINPPTSTPAEPVKTSLSFLEEIRKSSTFDAVKINSKIDVRNGSFIPTLDAVIYIENGKKVWTNLVAVILQAARGIATPEGVKGYYKLDKTYIDSDFSYLNKLLNVDFIDYNALQNLIVGKTFIPINENAYRFSQDINGYRLESKYDDTTVSITSNYQIVLDYDINYYLKHVYLKDKHSNKELEIYYSNHQILNGESFPKNVKIIIKGDKTDEIILENTKFDFSTMETPYSVPANYTKTEIK